MDSLRWESKYVYFKTHASVKIIKTEALSVKAFGSEFYFLQCKKGKGQFIFYRIVDKLPHCQI